MVCLLGLMVWTANAQQPAGALTVVSSGPTGEVANLKEANEIRIVFSEPMVVLGRIPQPVTVPFVTITPAIAGTYRWSGTTILIFTPDPQRKLPFATRYDVTVAATATAVSGRRPGAPYSFSFTTPTVRLLSADWYRKNKRFDSPMVVALRFNQPVRAADIAAHTGLHFQAHGWDLPVIASDAEARLRTNDPRSLELFNQKIAAAARAASAISQIRFTVASDWDKEQFKPGNDLVVLEAGETVPPESWVRVDIDAAVPAIKGREVPGIVQQHQLELEPTFFVNGFRCTNECDPDDWNPIHLRRSVDVETIQKVLSVRDLTDPKQPIVGPAGTPKKPDLEFDEHDYVSLEDAGYKRQPPAHAYVVRLDAALESEDGQKLGYNWVGIVSNWHARAFTSFGDGHGVWETGAGLQLPFYARNFKDVTQWAAPITRDQLMERINALDPEFKGLPPGTGVHRTLKTTIDKIESHGLDLSRAVTQAQTGLVWAGIREGDPVPNAKRSQPATDKATIVQVTNLGINVKDSPQNTLVFVTRLDNGAPVAGARVALMTRDGREQWNGTTNIDGLALAPGSQRSRADQYKLQFVVVAEKDGDIAYLGSNWNEGIEPWEFGYYGDLREAEPILRGSVFTDRGVYRLGEEIHFKAILRSDAPSGISLLKPATDVELSIRDSQNKEIEKRTVKVNEWSSFDGTFTLPAEGSLGNYEIRAAIPEADAAHTDEYFRRVSGRFLVAAYRRPDFRVDATLTSASPIAGTTLNGAVTAKYLFGATMGARPVKWRTTREMLCSAPSAIAEHFTDARFVFAGDCDYRGGSEEVGGAEATLTPAGDFRVSLDTKANEGRPYRYTFEGDVEDVSRQHIAGRASVVIHPAPWYIGVMAPPYFADQKAGVSSAIVAVSNEGAVVPNVSVHVSLKQVQWNSVRRAEGQGFYTWETTRNETEVGVWNVTTGSSPVPLSIPLPSGGFFVLTAEAKDAEGHATKTVSDFYALGDGYTAWERFDHNRINLVPEKATYRPGDSARVMIQSPWEQATALVTTEREGVRSYRRFALTSSQQYVTIPITEADIPNMYVSILLVKGRTKDDTPDDGSDPGKPSFRLGYVELKVEDQTKRLSLSLTSNNLEYRPANSAKVDLDVKDARGNAAIGEVTLWAVDYGVLSLTSYRTPSVVDSVYVEKRLQVFNEDNRQRIVSRRALIPKGEDDGGGGGRESGMDGTMRKDFRVLAFWLGSVVTDATGHASVDVKLPESLTTYRIMAVAADRSSRFGSGETEIRINKPVTMKPAFPRFMAVGDSAYFGSVVTSQLGQAGTATVTMKSLTPNVLEIRAGGTQTAQVAAHGSAEVRFEALARSIGTARIQMTARVGEESDAFEDVIPVEVLSSPETVAAYGETSSTAKETLTMPGGVVPGFGGLHLELSSTAMVGLGEGARYLVEYPYGCAEQQGSRALALLLASDLGEAFRLPGINPVNLKETAQATIRNLGRFQCPSGGFAYWPGECATTSPYLTSYLLHVFQQAKALNYEVDTAMMNRAYDYLQRTLAEPAPTDDGWWPAYTAWQAFAVNVLVEGGRNQDSNINRLYTRLDRMPVFALAHLRDAIEKKGETGLRLDELQRRITNAILPEGGSAHVEELSDPYLLWFWNSNVKSSAIVLSSLVRGSSSDTLIRSMVRWLMSARKNGRWGNTQENAWAMEALVAYYKKYESAAPDFRAVVKLANSEMARGTFQGRSTEATVQDVPMATLANRAAPGTTRELTFTRDGSGTLFYVARLRYAADQLYQQGQDTGFSIARHYEPYVESGAQQPPSFSYKAGDLVRVTLSFDLTKERRFVAVTDPLPAGFEPVESWFATTASALAEQQRNTESQGGWRSWFQRGGFDHVERHDDRVQLFATRLAEGHHEFSYVVRATTAGAFRTAPAHVEEMYEPEVFGRTASDVVDVKR